jgi:hypothetical protein
VENVGTQNLRVQFFFWYHLRVLSFQFNNKDRN